jgi:hypothetical protein
MDGSLWLKVAAGLSFSMAACQAVISVWPAAAAYFQAPPALLNDRVRLFVVGGAAALIPVLFGVYALSGAGVIRRLPLVRTILVAVGSLFLLRGLFILLTFMVLLGFRQGPVFLAGAATHLIFLSAGIAFLGGAVLNWNALNSTRRLAAADRVARQNVTWPRAAAPSHHISRRPGQEECRRVHPVDHVAE